jgi:hypothetical protein
MFLVVSSLRLIFPLPTTPRDEHDDDRPEFVSTRNREIFRIVLVYYNIYITVLYNERSAAKHPWKMIWERLSSVTLMCFVFGVPALEKEVPPTGFDSGY